MQWRGGGSSSSGGSDGGDPDPKYKLVFQELSAFKGEIFGGYGVTLSPDQNNLYFAMATTNRLGRFQRDGSGNLTFDRYWIDGSGDVSNGLGGAFQPVVSPDGRHLYVTGFSDNALAVFNVDASGDLDFSRVLVDGSPDIDGRDTIDGLRGASDVVVSSDGRHVYVTGNTDDSLTFFTRDATNGALDFQKSFKDTDATVDGLEEAGYMALSPDGSNLYVIGNGDDALAVFNRDATTGALTFATFLKDGTGDVPENTLKQASDVVVSPDGRNVYVAAYGTITNALAVFNRDAGTGALTFEKAFKDGSDGLVNFRSPRDLTISADGKSLYVSSFLADFLADFDRDPATGDLTFRELISLIGEPMETSDPLGHVLSSDDKTLYVSTGNGIARFSREVR